MRVFIRPRIWRRAIPRAWKQTQLLNAAKLAACVAIAALNLLWRGHGILRSSPDVVRFAVVALVCYIVTTIAELIWLVRTGPKFTGFESTTSAKARIDSTDALAEELSALPPADLRDETLQLAQEMKSFEAGSDREFVNSLAKTPVPISTDDDRDEVLDKQSAELMDHNLRTWRAYRERFYRPARAFRDELRKRLGIRNLNSEPRIPALDRAILTGAKPIAQAADYLAGLARRLK
ncbi:MAG TPA: hypothetical protein VEK37_11965 [Gemmatimonadaceae bacterium]|nr:hypothetical protein [Gemmatimonadaceae bacterium]